MPKRLILAGTDSPTTGQYQRDASRSGQPLTLPVTPNPYRGGISRCLRRHETRSAGCRGSRESTKVQSTGASRVCDLYPTSISATRGIASVSSYRLKRRCNSCKTMSAGHCEIPTSTFGCVVNREVGGRIQVNSKRGRASQFSLVGNKGCPESRMQLLQEKQVSILIVHQNFKTKPCWPKVETNQTLPLLVTFQTKNRYQAGVIGSLRSFKSSNWLL